MTLYDYIFFTMVVFCGAFLGARDGKGPKP
jgi:hypothetical protein